MKAKASSLKDATAVTVVPPKSEVHADTTTRNVYFFPNDQATSSSNVYRARWDHAEHIEDFHMLAKLRALPSEDKTRVKNLVDELHAKHEKEVEIRKLREFGQSRRVFNQIWDNPGDAEYNNL
jgi:hypothetical protein